MLQAVNSKTKRRNAATQTNDTDNIVEIARLQEQVKLLQIEVDHLRKYNNDNSLSTLKAVTPKTSPINVDETLKDVETINKSLQYQSLHTKSNKNTARGCTCKGKCSSKMCGCVKKDARCGEWCRCKNSICQNQESKDTDQNKENLEHNELVDKHLENQGIVNKRLTDAKRPKGLFSPDVAIQTPIINAEQFNTAPLYFGGPEKLEFGSDEEGDKEYESKSIQKKLKELEDNGHKTTRHRRGRNKKASLDANNSEHVRKHRSISNEKNQGSSYATTEQETLRKNNSTQISMGNKELKQIDKRTNNYAKNIKHGMVSLRRGQKESKQSKIEDIKSDKIVHSNGTTSSASANDNIASTPIEPKETQSHKVQKPKRKQSSDMNEDTDDFNPMKPKHELSRTPVRGSNNETFSSNTSDTSSSTSVITTEEIDPEIPAELNQPEVNWEEYQSQLVACHKCNRKFHPLRIKKHVSCCKKV